MHKIEQLERDLQTPLIRNNKEALLERLTTDFIEVGRTGMKFDLEGILAILSDDDTQYVMWDFSLKELAPNLMQACYMTKNKGTCNTSAYRTSLWRFEEGHWKMFYHQATPTQEE